MIIIKKIFIFIICSLTTFSLDLRVGVGYSQANYVRDTSSVGDLYDSVSNSIYENNTVAPIVELMQEVYLGEVGFGASYEYGYKVGVETFDAIPYYAKAKVYLLPIDLKPYIQGSVGQVLYVAEENVDMEDGEFYSVGVGLRVEGVDLEVGVKNTNATRNGVDMVYGGFYFSVTAGQEALEIIN